jgi:hypothetical protein
VPLEGRRRMVARLVVLAREARAVNRHAPLGHPDAQCVLVALRTLDGVGTEPDDVTAGRNCCAFAAAR